MSPAQERHELQAKLIRELNGVTCRCQKPKNPRQSFCFGCYRTLPKYIQLALYKRVGRGYEEAHDKAVKFLERVQ